MTQPVSLDEARELIARHVAAIRKLRTYLAEHDPRLQRLSPAAARVLPYVTTPMTAIEIGRKLHLGEDTVKSHLRAVYRYLGVNSRAGAILAILEGAR